MPNLLPDLRRLPADAYPFAHSMVGPDGDINQLPNNLPPSYGETMPIFARRNQGVASDLDIPQDSETSQILSDATTDAIIAGADASQLPEAAIQEAAIAAESAISEASALVPAPFSDEQISSLRAQTRARLKRLDKALANLAAIEARTQRQEFWLSHLCKLHARIQKRLDARDARRGKLKGKRGGWFQQFRMARKERRDDTPFTRQEAIARVGAALRDGLIDRDSAARLIRGVIAGDPRARAIIAHPIVSRIVF